MEDWQRNDSQLDLLNSVTKFGEIKKSLWQHLRVNLVLGQNFEPSLVILNIIGQIFIFVNDQLLKK